MSIPLTGTGGLFTRVGTFGGLLNDINTSRGTTIPADVALINNQFETTDQNIITNLYTYLSSYQNACSAFNSPLTMMASTLVIQMANESQALTSQTLTNAMTALINQMKSTSQSVNRCTISDSVSYSGSNIGNPVVFITLYDYNNLPAEDCIAEVLTGTVSNDSQSSSGLVGIEPISILGQSSVSDKLSYLYPSSSGSGCSVSVAAVSGMTNGGSGTSNWLLNGSMETFTSNVPASWTISPGTAGTTVFQSTSIFYDGSSSVQFAGNSSEDTGIYQSFSSPLISGTTNAYIYPNSIYSFNCFIRTSSMPASGVLQVSLNNGSSPINDNSSTQNQVSVNLNTVSTSWQSLSGSFRTPNELPSTVQLRISLTTPLPSGYSVYIDRISFCQMTRLYSGGPYISIFSGNVNMIRGDSFTATINNAYNGQFQILFNKLFNMTSLGLILPSSVSPTIPDSLI